MGDVTLQREWIVHGELKKLRNMRGFWCPDGQQMIFVPPNVTQTQGGEKRPKERGVPPQLKVSIQYVFFSVFLVRDVVHLFNFKVDFQIQPL